MWKTGWGKKCININNFGCLFAARVVIFAEEVRKITNTEIDDKGNKMNKGCLESMNEILKLPGGLFVIEKEENSEKVVHGIDGKYFTEMKTTVKWITLTKRAITECK